MNRAEPLVSIVIPCHNGGEYVGAAIDSALGQSYRNCEVIVVDDGSQDGSVKILESYGGRIRFESGPNRGGSAARNRGVELARGEIIQFLDADDLLHPDKLERQVPVLIDNPENFVCSGWNVMRADGSSGGVLYPKDTDDLLLALLRGLLQVASPVHWKSTLLEVDGFDPMLSCCQELDLHLRLACRGMDLTVMRAVLSTVRKRLGSVGSDERRVALTLHDLLMRAFRTLERNGNLTEERRFALGRRLAWLGREHVQMGEVGKAKAILADAREIHPKAIESTYSGQGRLSYRLLGVVATERVNMLCRGLLPRAAGKAV